MKLKLISGENDQTLCQNHQINWKILVNFQNPYKLQKSENPD